MEWSRHRAINSFTADCCGLPARVYYFRIEANGTEETGRLTLVR